ncbi:MAG: hypothetical protein ACFB2W_17670 [Leptolyngbyaceae cyanobacterium]
MNLKKVEKSFWKGLVISAIALSLMFQGCKAQTSSDACHKLSQRSTFRNCMQEKFPLGSDFYELEQFLIQQGFTKTVDEPREEDFFFVFVWWYPVSLKQGAGVSVGGKYDQQSRIVELVVP